VAAESGVEPDKLVVLVVLLMVWVAAVVVAVDV
jgi:hypothetical protein